VAARLRRASPPPLGDAVAFLVAGGLVSLLAFDGGGYDLVVRQEVALAVWVAIGVSFAVGVLPRARPGRPAFLALGVAAAYLAWMGLSLSWTGSDERTVAEIARVLGYIGIVTLALSALDRRSFRAAAAGLSAAAAVVITLAVASRLLPSAFPEATDVALLFRADRLDFPLDYWNAVGAWGAMSIAAAVAWSSHASSRAVRALSLAVVPVAGLGVYLTYSRGGAIASTVAVIAVLVVSRNRWTVLIHVLAAAVGVAAAILVVRSQPEIANATGGGGGGLVAIILLLAAIGCAAVALLTDARRTDRFKSSFGRVAWAAPAAVVVLVVASLAAGSGPPARAWDQFRNDEAIASGPDPAVRLTSAGGNRNELWSSALQAFEAHPLEGTGPGTYEWWWSREARNSEFVRDAHSLYLEHLAELGLPGLLLLLGSLASLLALAVVARSRLTAPSDLGASVAMISIFAVFLVSSGIDWMWEETAVSAIALGAIAVAGAGASEPLGSRTRGERIGRRWIRAAAVLIALVAAAVEVPGIVSTQRIRDSEAAAREGDLQRSGTLAQEAVDAAPWAASPHQQLALVREAQGRLSEAEREIREAIGKEPDNWQHPLVLARIELKQGRLNAARRTFEAGARLRPLLPSYWPSSQLGRRLYGQKASGQTAASAPGSP
jgi:O-antigen ligase